MSNDASRLWVIPLAASACLFLDAGLAAQTTDELPSPQEPWLAEEGDWAADFNEAQLACYQGSMRAGDSIWLSERVLFNSFLSEYGRTCGGRADLSEMRRANLSCVEAFPGHD